MVRRVCDVRTTIGTVTSVPIFTHLFNFACVNRWTEKVVIQSRRLISFNIGQPLFTCPPIKGECRSPGRPAGETAMFRMFRQTVQYRATTAVYISRYSCTPRSCNATLVHLISVEGPPISYGHTSYVAERPPARADSTSHLLLGAPGKAGPPVAAQFETSPQSIRMYIGQPTVRHREASVLSSGYQVS
jgi:hypothetical protein